MILNPYLFPQLYRNPSSRRPFQSIRQWVKRRYSQRRTVYGHISTPVPTRRASARSNQHYIALDHITPLQRKRHQESSPSHVIARRRKVEAEPPAPTRSLVHDYNKRKAATSRFPPKITPLHIRAAMRRYEVAHTALRGSEFHPHASPCWALPAQCMHDENFKWS